MKKSGPKVCHSHNQELERGSKIGNALNVISENIEFSLRKILICLST